MKFLPRLLFVLLALSTALQAEKKPNIVVMLADDMGYGDMSYMGHEYIQTPNLDRLAAEGMTYMDHHSADTVCSPSRAGFLTGRQPRRSGIYGWIPEHGEIHLMAEEITVAEVLKEAGYQTSLIGKFHLNGWFNSELQPQPNDHGFDYWFATQNNAHPTHHNPDNFVRNGEPMGVIEGYSSAIIAEEAINWLGTIEGDQPYALFVWFHAPHEPIETSEKFMAMYDAIPRPERATYYGNVSEMDHYIGEILKAIDARGDRDDTLVYFSSDNGPCEWYRKSYGEAGALRGMKGMIWEGAHRVPGIIRWPAQVPAGIESDALSGAVDFLPTVAEIVDEDLPQDVVIDGGSLIPTFDGGTVERGRPMFWEKHWKEGPHVAMRDKDWKIVASYDGKGGLDDFELFNLREDLGETTDLSSQYPERFERMKAEMLELRQEIIDEGPVWPTPEAKIKKSFTAVEASSYSTGHDPAYAIDDNKMTRWSSEHGNDREWISFELEKTRPLNTLVILWENAAAKVYDVQVSEDGKRFETIATIKNGEKGERRKVKLDGRPVRHIRIQCKERLTQWGYSIYEIYVR